MHRFLKDRSEVSIAYDVRRLEHVVEAVQIGAADVGLVLGLDRHPAVNVEVLSRTHMVAVLPNVKGLAEAAVTAKALSDSDFIGLENSSRLGQKVRAAFDRDGASYRPRVEVRYCSTATVLVSVGIGAARRRPLYGNVPEQPGHRAASLSTADRNPDCHAHPQGHSAIEIAARVHRRDKEGTFRVRRQASAVSQDSRAKASRKKSDQQEDQTKEKALDMLGGTSTTPCSEHTQIRRYGCKVGEGVPAMSESGGRREWHRLGWRGTVAISSKLEWGLGGCAQNRIQA